MRDLIALEEHFALDATLGDSHQYAVGGGWSGLERRLLDLHDLRLAEMDRHGVALAIVSLNSPAIQAIPETAAAVNTARRANDVLAEAIAARSDRLGGFAALPMQDPEAAAAELRRAVEDLGLVGALVNGFSDVTRGSGVAYYDAPEYLPFWAEVERLGVPFYLHPRDPRLSREPILDGVPWLQGPAWAFGVETATHALRLMTSGLFDRYPRLHLILGHLGEGLPFTAWRIDHRIGKSPRGIPAQRSVTEYLRRNFFLTTSGQFRTAALIDTISEVGSERVLFSIDYPFEETADAVEWFRDAAIAETDRRDIGYGNAARLFGYSVT
ncbi:MAG: amidohydrolase family protein [Vicinamibacterales bacterium]